jgi:hypothetical protein
MGVAVIQNKVQYRLLKISKFARSVYVTVVLFVEFDGRFQSPTKVVIPNHLAKNRPLIRRTLSRLGLRNVGKWVDNLHLRVEDTPRKVFICIIQGHLVCEIFPE